MQFHSSLLLSLLALVPLLSSGGSPPHTRDEVIEYFPDGEVQRRYQTNAEGQKHGAFMEYAVDGTLLWKARYEEGELDGREQKFFETGERYIVATWKSGELHGRYERYYANGQRELSTNYKSGVLSGKHTESSEDGKWVLTASYKADLLDGPLKVKDHGKVLTLQKWKAGRLLRLDDLIPFPRLRDEVIEELVAIWQVPVAEEPEASSEAPAQADSLAGDRAAALRRLQAYRALCNLPWQDMTLNPEWNALCDATAEILRRIGTLTHTPERPPNTDEELYRRGAKGASNSNIGYGFSLPASVDFYMDDSDPENIDRVGHRRWCLNPPMKSTGFGMSETFSAMWARDASGKGTPNMTAVLFPPPGYVPTQMFGEHYAWSITPLGGALPKPEKIVASVQALGEHYLPMGGPSVTDYLTVSAGGFGAGPCLIFRPTGVTVSEGRAYRCRVSFDGGRSWDFDYIVEFVSDERLERK